jgi:hypothetical protein
MNGIPTGASESARGDSAFAVLRRFVRSGAPKERCELCGAELGPAHQHLFEFAQRRLVCSCDPCALLFSGQQTTRYRRVFPRLRALPDFQLSDEQWENLHLPIDLAFFFFSSAAGQVVAVYPSPAGPTEALVPADAWDEVVEHNAALEKLEPDVEALLVNRTLQARDYYRVSIDECYRLVGLIRTHWRGLSGGTQVWKELRSFFAELKNRSRPPMEADHG